MINIETPSKEEAMMAAYLIHKHDYIKNQLLKPLKENIGLVDYGPDDVYAAQMILMTELALKLQISPIAAWDFVFNVNVEDLLK